jgi:hypothetical protein
LPAERIVYMQLCHPVCELIKLLIYVV